MMITLSFFITDMMITLSFFITDMTITVSFFITDMMVTNLAAQPLPRTGWNMYGIAQEAATAEGRSPSVTSRNSPVSVSKTPTAIK